MKDRDGDMVSFLVYDNITSLLVTQQPFQDVSVSERLAMWAANFELHFHCKKDQLRMNVAPVIKQSSLVYKSRTIDQKL